MDDKLDRLAALHQGVILINNVDARVQIIQDQMTAMNERLRVIDEQTKQIDLELERFRAFFVDQITEINAELRNDEALNAALARRDSQKKEEWTSLLDE